jgi:hypothetical protein
MTLIDQSVHHHSTSLAIDVPRRDTMPVYARRSEYNHPIVNVVKSDASQHSDLFGSKGVGDIRQ